MTSEKPPKALVEVLRIYKRESLLESLVEEFTVVGQR